MVGSILRKLEIDVMQVNELMEASELTMKYRLPAMVVHPNLASEALMARMKVRGQYQLIIPIDWPKGENFGNVKFRGISKQALEADGYEIMVTPGKSSSDTKKEILILTKFVRDYLGEFVDVRFVLGNLTREKEEIVRMCESIICVRNPALIRSDTVLKIQQNKANADVHSDFVNTVGSSGLQCPLKLSGNMNNLKSIASAPQVHRYAVNIAQAKTIIKEYSQQPNELREILADT